VMGEWSRDWLDAAPEIHLGAGMEKFEEGGLCAAFDKARRKLTGYEELGAFGCELGYLPVTDACPDTGRAAQAYSRERKRWVSREALRKDAGGREYTDRRNGGDEAAPIWKRVLRRGDYRSPLELDDLGPRENDRHIAVVHCDGNGIGKLFHDL